MSAVDVYANRAAWVSLHPNACIATVLVDSPAEDAGVVAAIQDAVEAGDSLLLAATSAEALAYASSIAECVMLLTPPAGQTAPTRH